MSVARMILGDLTMSPRAHSGARVIHEAGPATDGQDWRCWLIIMAVGRSRATVIKESHMGTEFTSGRCTVELPRSTNATSDRCSWARVEHSFRPSYRDTASLILLKARSYYREQSL